MDDLMVDLSLAQVNIPLTTPLKACSALTSTWRVSNLRDRECL
jgi:hypothetical protein